MNNLRGRNEFNLFLQLGHHLPQNLIGDGMGMSDTDRLAMALGNSNQFFYLLADKIRILEMIEKNIPLGERNLKQACRWFAERFACGAAVYKIQVPFFRIEKIWYI